MIKVHTNISYTTNQDVYRTISRKKPKVFKVKPVNNLIKTPIIHTKSIPLSLSQQKVFISKSFYEPSYYQNRMKKIMRGSDSFMTWVYDKNVTSYQNTFYSTGLINSQKINVPFRSSTVIKLLPSNN